MYPWTDTSPHKSKRSGRRVWEDERTFHTADPPPGEEPANHWYQLEMLPYPSGTLHMGHVLNYSMGDVLTHFRRRNGWTVLRPMGWDSFGLPAENAAIKEGGHPREIVERNIVEIRNQMKRIGWAIDWDREVGAHEPEFYRWTQWLFLRFYERGLAYRKAAPVNWCPFDQTVIANEYVVDGRCDRCGNLVELRNLEQWFFKITAYADELLRYEGGSWPERTVTIQRNWIGRSEGAEILFRDEELDTDIPVFTTRPDTLYGATFFVLAPEHPLVERIANDEVAEYVKATARKKTEERAAEQAKTGVFTGHFVDQPGERRAAARLGRRLRADGLRHRRDHGRPRARRARPRVRRDLRPADRRGDHRGGHARQLRRVRRHAGRGGEDEDRRAPPRGRPRRPRRLAPPPRLELRPPALLGLPDPDRLLRRLRRAALPDDQLPLILPEVEDYRPKGKPPLATATDWINTTCPKCGGPATREADTMDTFVDSSWYFLRYVDPHNDREPFDRRLVDYWAPVSHYIGGIDHATGHLLYSRFFVKVMKEMGLVGFSEPFDRVFHQGWVTMGGTKMSKSKGNVVGPDDVVDAYGADPVRLYILFMGPADKDMEWTDAGVEGMVRFVRRLWRVVHDVAANAPAATRAQAR